MCTSFRNTSQHTATHRSAETVSSHHNAINNSVRVRVSCMYVNCCRLEVRDKTVESLFNTLIISMCVCKYTGQLLQIGGACRNCGKSQETDDAFSDVWQSKGNFHTLT